MCGGSELRCHNANHVGGTPASPSHHPADALRSRLGSLLARVSGRAASLLAVASAVGAPSGLPADEGTRSCAVSAVGPAAAAG